MSGTPTAAYSIRIRARLDNVPGVLGRLAAAIGQVGGNIWALEGFEAKHEALDEDIIVNCASEAHQQEVLAAVRQLEGVDVLEWDDRTFTMHQGGKIEVLPLMTVGDRDDLSMAYTPGVARVCKAIEAEPDRVHDLTIKKNTVAIVTDGTAVLGLGDIGPAGALPVMEGKALLFKEFAGVDGFPICLDCANAEEIVESVQRIAPVFGGINLEDIAAPQCFEVEERLKELLDIPVFHDDQHGTAVVVLAALQNALRIVDKKMADLNVVVAGVGAAGVACAKILMEAGVPHVVGVDRKGAIWEGRDDLNPAKVWFAENTNPDRLKGSLSDVMPGGDVFIGVSGPGLLKATDLDTMGRDPIVFALANPDPEIRPEEARGRAAVIATGRSDYPNQINNVLCFPGIFRGALDAGATSITENMKLAAADAIASAVGEDELAPDFVIPSVFDKRVSRLVADAAAAAAVRDGVVRRRP
jgi:malate dehydrogenase (oxaloacetate-decarboxylating)